MSAGRKQPINAMVKDTRLATQESMNLRELVGLVIAIKLNSRMMGD